MSKHVTTPIMSPEESVRYGSVGSVKYRDTIGGIRFTAHWGVVVAHGWIVEHEPTDRTDTDGTPVRWSGPIPGGRDALNAMWQKVRAGH